MPIDHDINSPAKQCADADRKRIKAERELPYKLLSEVLKELKKPINYTEYFRNVPPINRTIEIIHYKLIEDIENCIKKNLTKT
jgi:hypothetical protein